jgi:succinate dehydrogenase hydrophobic anchor subunit
MLVQISLAVTTMRVLVCHTQGSIWEKVADWGLAVAVPVHMHITTNACVTDYVPTRFRRRCRASAAEGGSCS